MPKQAVRETPSQPIKAGHEKNRYINLKKKTGQIGICLSSQLQKEA
jgi:hypothetical protein